MMDRMVGLLLRDCFSGLSMPARCALALLLLVIPDGVSFSTEEPPSLNIRLEVGEGPFYVGQGIDLAVVVTAGDQRPALELPRPAAASLWVVDTAFRPVSVSAIGRVVAGSNLFVTRLRLVARRAGALLVPPIGARVGARRGRTPATTLLVEPVPLEGRPAAFLGGVGDFSVHASASPAVATIGQEILYRIDVTGPAAWGTTSRPELDRLAKLPIAPLVEPLSDEEIQEPPRRSFFWRIRPTRPGSAVLPPVAVAAFEPRTRRYLTRVSPGTPVRVAAVPEPAGDALAYAPPARSPRSFATGVGAALVLTMLASAFGAAILLLRQRRAPRSGPAAARRFARTAAAFWCKPADRLATIDAADLARRILADLVEYARLGSGRPAGALTPEEARAAVFDLTRQNELAARAVALVESCDRALFSERVGDDPWVLRDRAGLLFAALAQPRPTGDDS